MGDVRAIRLRWGTLACMTYLDRFSSPALMAEVLACLAPRLFIRGPALADEL